MTLHENLVYDAGANCGQDTDFYLKKGFRVVAVEANASLCEKLKSRFSPYLADGTLTIVAAAIAERSGTVTFYESTTKDEWSSTDPEVVQQKERYGAAFRRTEVPALRFEEILSRNGIPHYLKIDIEGSEMLCLDALRNFSLKPSFVSVESGGDWDWLHKQFDALQAAGYDRFKIVDQNTVPRQKPPRPAREGQDVDYRFPLGCSGLFGNELPGKWLTRDKALQSCGRIVAQVSQAERLSRFTGRELWLRAARKIPIVRDYFLSTWYDIHATRSDVVATET
jgi:FkbM family methyltransferase